MPAFRDPEKEDILAVAIEVIRKGRECGFPVVLTEQWNGQLFTGNSGKFRPKLIIEFANIYPAYLANEISGE